MKKLTREEMKNVMGGVFAPLGRCSASASCSNGTTVSCEGFTQSYEGSVEGCSGTDNNGVHCYNGAGGTIVRQCNGQNAN